MEISVYFTRDGNVSIIIFGSMSKISYQAVVDPKELPIIPGYAEHPFARTILHAFSEQEREKWKE